jgi:hypothetical protein
MLRRVWIGLKHFPGGAEFTPLGAVAEDISARNKALGQQLDELGDDLERAKADPANALVEDLQQRATGLKAEQARLGEDSTQLSGRLNLVEAAVTRRTVRVAQASLLAELATVAIGVKWPGSPKTAHSIHMDYYSAVAAIAPVLLIAGFVEVVVLRPMAAVWVVLSFAVPAVGAITAALAVLATHRSTAAALYLTKWGLGMTLLLLVTYFAMHAASPPPTPDST